MLFQSILFQKKNKKYHLVGQNRNNVHRPPNYNQIIRTRGLSIAKFYLFSNQWFSNSSHGQSNIHWESTTHARFSPSKHRCNNLDQLTKTPLWNTGCEASLVAKQGYELNSTLHRYKSNTNQNCQSISGKGPLIITKSLTSRRNVKHEYKAWLRSVTKRYHLDQTNDKVCPSPIVDTSSPNPGNDDIWGRT